MNIGIVRNPFLHPDWQQIKRLLEPAAKRGGVPILEPHEEVWAVYGDGLEAAATARLTTENFGEVILVGGKRPERWLEQLDQMIGAWMQREGKAYVRAYGRRGWTRQLARLGWRVIGEENGVTGYERAL